MKETLTRSYSMRVCRGNAIPLLEKTHKVYNRGSAFFMDFWLDLLGGMNPSHLGNKPPEEMAQFLLPLWFTLESGGTETIAPEKIQLQFREYWLSQGGNDNIFELPEMKTFFATIKTSARKGAVWVDRRKNCQLSQTDLDVIFSNPKFILFAADSRGVRQLLSDWWGEGEKTNWAQTAAVAKSIKFFMSKIKAGEVAKTVGYNLYQHLGISTSEPRASLQAKLAKKGNPGAINMFANLIYNDSPLTDETIQALTEVAGGWEARASRPNEKRPWMKVLLDKFEESLGISYYGEKRCLLEEAAAMFGMAIARHRSWHTWFRLQMKERVNLAKDLGTANDKYVNPIIREAAIKHRGGVDKDTGRHIGDYLALRQFRGIGRFLSMCERGTPPNEILAELCKSGDVGDVEMFGDLAKATEGIAYHEVKASVDHLIEQEKAAERFHCLKTPCLRHIDDTSPVHPWFGTSSKPYGNLPIENQPLNVYKPKDGMGLRTWATVNLFDGKNFVATEIPLIGKRFRNEIYRNKDAEVVAPRGTMLAKAHLGNQEFSIDVSQPSLQLRPNKDKWYFNISLGIITPLLPKVKDIAESFSIPGTSFLSLDLGQKEAVAFAHYRIDPNGDVVVEKGKEKIRMSIVECGFLRENQLTSDGRTICRLHDRGRDCQEKDYEVWTALCQNPKFAPPKSVVSLNKDVANFVCKIARWNELENVEQHLKVALDQIMGRNHGLELQRDHGSLSFGRMETIRTLLSAFQSYNSRLLDNKKEVPIWIVETLDLLRMRLNNIRRERARITANLIVRKALDTGSRLIVMEDLDISANQGNTKWGNRRTTDWCCRRIVEMVAGSLQPSKSGVRRRAQNGLAAEYGIFVKPVFPAGSSMEDFMTGEYKCRFRLMNVDDLDKEYVKKQLRNLIRQPIGSRENITRSLCLAKLENLGLEINEKNLREALIGESKDGKVYVPWAFGDYYYTEKYGWIDSDVSAAMTLGKRGLKVLMGWSSERVGDGTAKEEENGRNSNGRNGMRSKKPLLNLSQIAKRFGVMSWGRNGCNGHGINMVTWRPARRKGTKVVTDKE